MRACHAVLILLTIATRGAAAQPARAQAEDLFRKGRELISAGKIAEACSSFDASEALDASISTELHQAFCRERNGQFATAWGIYVQAARHARDAANPAIQAMRRIAMDNAAKLEPRLSKLTIVVDSANRVEGLEVRRQGELVGQGAWGYALPIDGGTHQIVVRAPNHADWTTTFVVKAESDAAVIIVPALVPVAETRPAAAPVIERVPSPPPPHSRTRALVAGAGGIILLSGALGLELWGESSYNAAKAERVDLERRHALYDTANQKRYAAEVSGVVGAAALGMGIWWYVRGPGEPASPRLTLQPSVGAGAGLAVSGTY